MPEIIGKGILGVAFDPKQIEQAGKEQLLPSVKRLAGDAASIVAAVKLTGFVKEGIDELKQAQQVDAQTAVLLKNRGEAAGVTKEQIDALGQSMLNLAGFDDEAARSASNVLLRFDAIKGSDTFTRVEKDSADLAVTMGTDLPAAAELLGRALQNPDKAMRLLRPVIGQLSQAQQDSIAAFLAQGDVASAQGVILDALEGKVQGAAAAFGQTLPGRLKIAQESLKNTKAEITAGMAPALEIGANAVTFLTGEMQKLPGTAQAVVGGAVLVGAGVASIARPVHDLVSIFRLLKPAQVASTIATEADVLVQTEDAAATTSNAAAHGLLSTSLGKAGVAGAALFAVGALYAYGQSLNKTTLDSKDLDGILHANAQSADVAIDAIMRYKGSFVDTDTILKQIADAGDAGIGVLRNYRQHLVDTGQSTEQVDKILGNAATAQANYTSNVDAGTDSLDAQKQAADEAAKKIDALAKADAAAAGLVDKLSTAMSDQYEAGLKNTDQVSNYEGALDDLVAKLKGDPGRVTNVQDKIASANDKVAASARDVTDAQRKLDELNAKGPTAHWKGQAGSTTQVTADQMISAEEAVADAQKAHDKAIKDLGDSQHDLNDAQKQGLFTLDLTTAKGRENVKAAEDTGRAIKDLIVQRFKDTGSTKDAVDTGNIYIQNLKDQLAAAGYNEDQIAQMIDVMNLTPGDLNTTFTNNAASQQIVIGEYLKLIDQIPPKQQHEIETYINMDKFNEAKTLLDFLTGNYTDVNLAVSVVPGQTASRAEGGPLGPNQRFLGAEQGFEILLKKGMYQAPPDGGYVLPTDQSAAFLGGMSGGVRIDHINVYGEDAPSAVAKLTAEARQVFAVARRG